MPYALERWQPYDYWQYTQMGEAVRQGRDPLGPGRYYPLPTILWIFVPLSLMPLWFRWVWVFVPIVFLFILFKRDAIPLLLFTPLWFNVSDAMLDGWLLFPMAWVLTERPILAGLGAVVLLTKPQLAILTVGYAFLSWVRQHDKKNLAAFAIGLTIFVLPAFMVDPNWVTRLLTVLPLRASETITVLPTMTSSVWSWQALGTLGFGVWFFVLLVAGVLFVRAFRHPSNRASAIQAMSMSLLPVLFASNLIVLLPTLLNRKQITLIVLASLAAFALDLAVRNFGGGYVLIPLLVLYFQTRASDP